MAATTAAGSDDITLTLLCGQLVVPCVLIVFKISGRSGFGSLFFLDSTKPYCEKATTQLDRQADKSRVVPD